MPSNETSRDLEGQVVIITGAGKGIGRAAALQLARNGARVLVNNRRAPGQEEHASSAAQVVAQIRREGRQAAASFDDATDRASGARMVQQALDLWGRLDMVYANAAIAQGSTFENTALDDLLAIIDAGVVGTASLLHAAWPVMRQQRYGRALVSTSSAGRFGGIGLSAYGASKGAIEALMRSLALEGARHGIRCNAISPYATSQMTRAHLPADLASQLEPDCLGPVVAWLLSPRCEVTGQVVVAGGGRMARAWTVETRPVASEVPDTAWATLRIQEGLPHADAGQAFAVFMRGG